MQLYIPLPHLQSINLSSALAQRSGISAPDRNKESEKYDKYAANDLFDILNSWRIINIRDIKEKIDDPPQSYNKHPTRFKRSIMREIVG